MADEYYSIPAEPKYREQIRKLQNSDPADADKTFNPLIETLIENTAAVKKQADGVEGVLPITGDGAPTPETAGSLGQHYFDTDTGDEYVCTGVSEDGKTSWRQARATDASDLAYNGGKLSDHLDKLTKDVADSKPLTGYEDPTNSTAGKVGQHYLNTVSGKEYICVAADEESGTYTWVATSGGILPRLIIDAPTGSAIKVSDGIKTFTPIESEGVWQQDVPDFGIYTVTAEIGAETFTQFLDVSEVKIHNVRITGFEAVVDVFSPEGAMITWSIGGRTHSIVSAGHCPITVDEPGAYTFTRKHGERIVTREIEVTKNGSTVQLVLSMRYGYKKKKSEGNPYARIEYLYDAVDMTPAYMDFDNDEFVYGDWGDAWFVRKNRPVMLKYDRTVDYELNHSNQTRKLDGSPSDISNTSYQGNAMSEFPLGWVCRYEDDEYEYEIVCEHQWDDNYKAYAHTRADGSIADCFYWSMFGGSGSVSKIRSLADQNLLATTDSAQRRLSGCTANGEGWYSHTWSQRKYICTLLILLGKSTNTQAVFGIGSIMNGSSADTHLLLKSGLLKNKGQFFGYDQNGNQVKVFYIEQFWGNQSELVAGLLLMNNKWYYKMTPEGNGYSFSDVSDYTDSGITAPNVTAKYISATKCGEFGCVPVEATGSATTYECDWLTTGNTSSPSVTFAGGPNASSHADGAGAFTMRANGTFTEALYWAFNCGLSAEQPVAAQAT